MQEHIPDAPNILTDHPTQEQVMDALRDPRNTGVTLHKPGSIVTLESGRRYEVMKDGSWRKLEL